MCFFHSRQHCYDWYGEVMAVSFSLRTCEADEKYVIGTAEVLPSLSWVRYDAQSKK